MITHHTSLQGPLTRLFRLLSRSFLPALAIFAAEAQGQDPGTPLGNTAPLNPPPPPPNDCPPVMPSFDETSGMRFKRIGLDGQMISDQKEQSKEESDEANEETYVDSLTSHLRHDTSDFYIPLPGNELSLAIKRSTSPESWTWNTDGFLGENPAQHIGYDRPFGMAWSSGLGATLRVESYYSTEEESPCPTSLPPTMIFVTDESGASYRFTRVTLVENPGQIPADMDVEEALDLGLARTQYLPLPSNRTEHSAFFNTLERAPVVWSGQTPPAPGGTLTRPAPGATYTGGGFTLTRKFGTKLEYAGHHTVRLPIALNEDNTRFKIITYFRLLRATDRFNNVITYDFTDAPEHSLIPSAIKAQSGTTGADRQLEIEQDGGLVTKVTDPLGNSKTYEYVDYGTEPNKWVGHLNPPYLSKVTNDEGHSTLYKYNKQFVDIEDDTPRSDGDDSPRDKYYNILLGAIGSNASNGLVDLDGQPVAWDNGEKTNWTVFHYKFDNGFVVPAVVKKSGVYVIQYYNPYFSRTPIVSGSTLGASMPYDPDDVLMSGPGVDKDVFFERQGVVQFGAERDPETGYITNTVTGERYMNVTDADGVARVFRYGDKQVINGKEIENAFVRANGPRAPFYILAWEKCDVEHPPAGTTPATKETARFNMSAGLADSEVVDFSGNTTVYTHGDQFWLSQILGLDQTSQLAIAMNKVPFFKGSYNDPTREEFYDGPATGTPLRTSEYSYKKGFGHPGSRRVMTSITIRNGGGNDPIARTTQYEVDEATGNRTQERIYTGFAADLHLVSKTDFAYHPDIKGFRTTTTVHNATWNNGSNPHHVTVNVPDTNDPAIPGYGYIASSTVDPGGLNLTTLYEHDENGNQIKVTDPKGNITSFTYDKINRLVTTTLPDDGVNGTSTKRTFWSPSGRVLAQQDERDNRVFHRYDKRNRRVMTIVDMDGAGIAGLGEETGADLKTETKYTEISLVKEVTDARGVVTQNFYDGLHRLESMVVDVGGLNLTTTYTYTGDNVGGSAFSHSQFKPTIKTDPRGIGTKVEYDAFYRPIKTWLQIGNGAASYSETGYNVLGNKTIARTWRATAAWPNGTPSGAAMVNTTTYDALDRPLVSTTTGRSAGSVTSTVVSTHTSKVTYRVATTSSDSSGKLTKVTETDFDAAGRPIAVWEPDATTGLVVRTTPGDPVLGSSVSTTAYDANGNAIAVMHKLGNVTRTAYDSRNRAIKLAVNPVTGNPADPAGAPASGDQITSTVYDHAGNPVSVTDARNITSTTEYDNAGRAFRTTTPQVPVYGQSGNQALVTENVFDKGGNIIEAIDAAGSRTRNVYDGANRLVATATNPVSGNPSANPLNSPGANDIVIINEYDEGGNLLSVTDGLGQITEFVYDGLSRKLQTEWDANDSRAKIDQIAAYDALLQVSATDALGRVTHRHYDGNDRLTGIECAAATAESRTSIMDQEGQVLKILHGGHNLPDTTALNADIRHVGMAYDRLGRVVSETSAGVTHASTWDKGGNRLTVAYGGTGRVLTSTYDKLQRLDTLSEKRPSETTPRLTSYAYDENGNVTGKTHPNGTSESTTYDALNRRLVHQVTVGSTVLSSFAFLHDKLSNVAQIIESYDPSAGIAGRTVTNTYDKGRRLLVETAAEPGKTVATTYGYDQANNRTSKVVATTPSGGATTTTETHGYVYGHSSNGLNSNQLWKWIKPGGVLEVVYSYDANGNRSTRTETIGGTQKTDTYTWDHWNRLTNLDLQSKDAAVNGAYAYGYDHRTRRVVRDESAISGRTRDMVIYSGGTSVQEHEGESGATPANAANPDMEYIRGSDWGGGVGGILYTSRAGVVSWAHYNGRGDVVTRTSDVGSLTYAASYEAFGTRTQEAGTNPDRQRANTKEEDPTGLLNEGHRYRDLELGMFISRDPAGFVDGPNVYTYVVQNPWSSFDPEGLESNHAALEAAYEMQPEGIRWLVRPMVNALKRADDYMDRSEAQGNGRTMTTGETASVLAEGGSTNLALMGGLTAAPRIGVAILRNPATATNIAGGLAETIAQVDGPSSVPDLGDVNKATKALAAGVEQTVGSESARKTLKEGVIRVQHATSNEAADKIFKEQTITSTSDFVYGVEAKVPGKVAVTRDEILDLGAKDAETVIEFDVPADEVFKNEVGDVTLPSPLDLKGRNPTRIPVKNDD